LSGRLAISEIEENTAETLVKRAEATALVTAGRPARGEVTSTKAEISQMPNVIKYRDALDNAYAYRKMCQVLYNAVERDASLCSRELTRRTAMTDITRRVDRNRA